MQHWEHSVAKDVIDLEVMIEDLLASEQQQSNCMFQLSLMIARMALEPGSENFKDEMAQAMLGLIRAKPKSNVVKIFGVTRTTVAEAPRIRVSA